MFAPFIHSLSAPPTPAPAPTPTITYFVTVTPTGAPVTVQVTALPGPDLYEWLMFAVSLLSVLATILVAIWARGARTSARRAESEAIVAGTASTNETTRVEKLVPVSWNVQAPTARAEGIAYPPDVEAPGPDLPRAAPILRVEWSAVQVNKTRWRLQNQSSSVTARNVEVSGRTEADRQDIRVLSPESRVFDVEPEGYIFLLVEKTFASPAVAVVVVSWEQEGIPGRNTLQIPLV